MSEMPDIEFPPIGISAIQDQRLVRLFALWDEARFRAGATIPKRADIFAETLAPWWPAITLFEFEGVPEDLKLRVRVHGGDIVHMDGANHTGKLLTEAYTPFLIDRIRPGYAFVAKTGQPIYQQREGGDLRGYPVVYEKMLPPLAGSDGALRFIINCLYTQQPPVVVSSADFQEAMRRGASRYLIKGTLVSGL